MSRAAHLITVFLAVAGSLHGWQQNAAAPAQPTKDLEVAGVCDVASGAKGRIAIRGFGRQTESGFLLSDATCPVSEGEVFLPRNVLILVKSFARQEDRRWFNAAQDLLERPFVQVIVRGRMQCKPGLRIEKAPDAYARGNGFGKAGLVACVMKEALVEGVWQ